jgi:hypothetical protein
MMRRRVKGMITPESLREAGAGLLLFLIIGGGALKLLEEVGIFTPQENIRIALDTILSLCVVTGVACFFFAHIVEWLPALNRLSRRRKPDRVERDEAP